MDVLGFREKGGMEEPIPDTGLLAGAHANVLSPDPIPAAVSHAVASRAEGVEPQRSLPALDAVEDSSDAPADGERELVPLWLAGLVLLLLLGVLGAAGFVVNSILSGDGSASASEARTRAAQGKVRQDPASAETHVELGFSYQREGKFDKALDEYELAMKIDPRNTAALYNKGMTYMQMHRWREAEQTLWQVLDIEPEHALAAKALGEYYAAKRQYRSMVIALTPAANANPSMADIQYLLGFSYEKQGKRTLAIYGYRAALKYVPDMKEARDGLLRLGVQPD